MKLPPKLSSIDRLAETDHRSMAHGRDRIFLAFRRDAMRAYAISRRSAAIVVVLGEREEALEASEAMGERCIPLTIAQYKMVRDEGPFVLSIVDGKATIRTMQGIEFSVPLEDPRNVDDAERILAEHSRTSLPKVAVNPSLLLAAMKALGVKEELVEVPIDSRCVITIQRGEDCAIVANCEHGRGMEKTVESLLSEQQGAA